MGLQIGLILYSLKAGMCRILSLHGHCFGIASALPTNGGDRREETLVTRREPCGSSAPSLSLSISPCLSPVRQTERPWQMERERVGQLKPRADPLVLTLSIWHTSRNRSAIESLAVVWWVCLFELAWYINGRRRVRISFDTLFRCSDWWNSVQNEERLYQ